MAYVPANRSAAERPEIMAGFFDGLSDEDASHSYRVAAEIAACKPLANTVAVIPVAVHQEAAQIFPAMAEYAEQVGDADPFTLVLNLNCPTSEANSDGTQATMDELERAGAAFPELDIRSFFRTYDEPRQGRIRRDAWNGVLRAAVLHDQIDEQQSVIVLNQDIDLLRMRRGSIAATQDEYARLAREGFVLPIGGMRMTHGKSEGHPNITTAVQWDDYIYYARGIAFEAGLIIPAEMYALFGGIRSTTRVGEVIKNTGEPHFFVRGAHAVTSPRRFHDRMHEDGYEIWQVQNFSATDACRDIKGDDRPDITREHMMQLIDGKVEDAGGLLGDSFIRSALRDYHRIFREHPEISRVSALDDAAVKASVAARMERVTRVTLSVLHLLTKDDAMVEKLRACIAAESSGRVRELLLALTNPTFEDLIQMEKLVPLR